MTAYQPYITAPIGLAVRHLRTQRGLTMGALAQLVYGEPSYQRIYALEAGRYARSQRSTVERLARALNTTVDDLVALAHTLAAPTQAAV